MKNEYDILKLSLPTRIKTFLKEDQEECDDIQPMKRELLALKSSSSHFKDNNIPQINVRTLSFTCGDSHDRNLQKSSSNLPFLEF